jgi:long-chain fatty acid transport protein
VRRASIRVALFTTCAFVFAAAGVKRAHGAGLSRPNIAGPRAIGLGGAFTAVADDVSAVWYNPAGPAFFGDNEVYLGGELVLTQRSYTPDPSSPLGQLGHTSAITENTAPTFLPMVGASSRFGFGKTKATRFALSLLAHLAYGGSISYNPQDIFNSTTMKPAGLTNTQILDYEITPALSYQVTDVLAIGAALRIGINAFSVDDQESAFHATLSTSGVGIGGTLGILFRPHRMVDIGAVYRTPLSATMTGGGPVAVSGQPVMNKDSSLSISWPQSAGLGVAVKPHWRVLASVQGDWTGWSSVQKLNPTLPGIPDATTTRPMRYNDTYALHLGLQTIITQNVLVRLGYALDSNAIPDSTVRRENQDSLKGTVAAGIGLHFWRVFIDAAFETLVPVNGTARVVSQQLTGTTSPDNEAGSYSAQVYSVEVAASLHF